MKKINREELKAVIMDYVNSSLITEPLLVSFETKIVARCDSCNSEWQNVHMGSAGQTNQEGKFWLICYDTELKGDSLYVSNIFNKKR